MITRLLHPRLKGLLTAVIAAAAMVAVSSSPAAAAETEDNAMVGCTYSVQDPWFSPNGTNVVAGHAPWKCSLAPDTAWTVWLRILEDGEILQESEFTGKGSVDTTFGTNAYCSGGGSHTYQIVTFGWDGSGPTSYPGKGSKEVSRSVC